MRAGHEIPAALGPARARVIAVVIAAPWILWATLRTLGLEHGHPLVALVAFTPYAAALSPLPVLVALLLRRRAVAAVAFVAALALITAVLPRALPGPGRAQADTRGRTLVVMSANLRFGHGDPAAVLHLVRRSRYSA